jgi:hypothetical protein
VVCIPPKEIKSYLTFNSEIPLSLNLKFVLLILFHLWAPYCCCCCCCFANKQKQQHGKNQNKNTGLFISCCYKSFFSYAWALTSASAIKTSVTFCRFKLRIKMKKIIAKAFLAGFLCIFLMFKFIYGFCYGFQNGFYGFFFSIY